MPGKVQVHIWSDLACPWCYVGKRRLDAALAQLDDPSSVEVTWHAYMIDPATDEAGEEYLAYNRRRWGGDGWTADLRRSGAPAGAAFADWRWWPNTQVAHRLAALAAAQGKGHQAAELLFQLTYERGQNISDKEVLRAAGRELGLPDAEVVQYLDGEAGLAEVLQDDATGKRELNIRGVPYFIVTGGGDRPARALSGAQSTAAILKALRQGAADA